MGEIFYPVDGSYTGYGDGQGKHLIAFIDAEMRKDWRFYRRSLLRFWASHAVACAVFDDAQHLYLRGAFNMLPWACKHLGEDTGPALRRELRALARPHRENYEKEVRDAEEMRDYYAELIRDPESDGCKSTGRDPETLRADLEEEEAKLTHWKKILHELDTET